jgi:Cu+-exporting ATPase
METVNLKLRGMSCASCANNIEGAIRSVPGVSASTVNFGAEQATVTYDPQKTALENIQAAVSEAGYAAFSLQDQSLMAGEDDTEKAARVAERRQLTRKVVVGGILSTVIMVGAMSAMFNVPFRIRALDSPWVQLVLATPVLFWCGADFFKNAWKAVKRHTATMDTLVAIGTGVAYSYSIFATVSLAFLPLKD